MTIFSFLSHLKRLPHANGRINFRHRERHRHLFRRESAPLSFRRGAITHTAASTRFAMASVGALHHVSWPPAFSVPKASGMTTRDEVIKRQGRQFERSSGTTSLRAAAVKPGRRRYCLGRIACRPA
jgi:hypothetical protein